MWLGFCFVLGIELRVALVLIELQPQPFSKFYYETGPAKSPRLALDLQSSSLWSCAHTRAYHDGSLLASSRLSCTVHRSVLQANSSVHSFNSFFPLCPSCWIILIVFVISNINWLILSSACLACC